MGSRVTYLDEYKAWYRAAFERAEDERVADEMVLMLREVPEIAESFMRSTLVGLYQAHRRCGLQPSERRPTR